MLKSPVTVIANPLSAACPEFVTVSVCVVEVVITATLPNVICVGLDAMPPTAIPFPSSGITKGATDKLLTETVSAPGWFPLAVGIKLNPTVHDEAAGRVVPQVVNTGTRA
jgi:hypothetical protein